MRYFENATLEARVAEALDGDMPLATILDQAAELFGRDAVMLAVLRRLGLEHRSATERLGELAFDLPPGAIQMVLRARNHIRCLMLPDGVTGKVEIALREYAFRARLGYDPGHGVLVVGECVAGELQAALAGAEADP